MNKKLKLALFRNTPILFFIFVFIVFGILSPKFFSIKNFESIVANASYIGILATGMTFVLLTGGVDLSVGSIMYMSTAVTGLLVQNHGFPVWAAISVGIMIGVVFGLVNAFFIVKMKALPFITTLSTMVAGKGVGLLITKSSPVKFPESITRIGATRLLNIPLPIILFVITVLIAHIILRRTTFGRQIYAIGNDMENARKAGINIDRVRFMIYIISGFVAAVGGIIITSQLGNVNASFGRGDEFDAIAAAVLGGTSLMGGVGSVFPGTMIGAITIQMIQAGLVYLQVDLYMQPIVTAFIIFGAVFIDSIKVTQIQKMEKRNIRNEANSQQGG